MYGIIHRPSGRIYVGSSCDVFRRWKGHVSWLGHGKHHCAALLDVWLLDGPAAFSFVVLEQCPKEDLQQREQEWLNSFEEVLNTSKDTRCPMFDPAVAARQGAKMRGRKFTAEHRANMSAAHRGLAYPARRTPRRGPLSDAQRAAISQTLMGHPVSNESRAKMRAAKLGKPLTKEHRAKLSAAFVGRIFSQDHRAKLTAAWGRRPRTFSEETRRKMSETHRANFQKQRALQSLTTEDRDGV